MRILHSADYRRMPWKNGGGETREVVVSPPGAALNSLDWRISLATISSGGPFSAFEDIDRTLCVIRGAGIRLQIGDATPELLLEHSEPYSFDGESPAYATLVEGAIVDLNVMTRRGRFRHAVKRRKIRDQWQLAIRASTTIIFCQRGEIECTHGSTSDGLRPEDCAILDSNTSRIGLRAAEPTDIILIEIFERPDTATST